MFTPFVIHLKDAVHQSIFGQYPWLDWLLVSLIDLLSSPLTGLRTRAYWPEIAAALVIAAFYFFLRDREPGQRARDFITYCVPRSMYLHQSTWVDCKLIVANHFVTPLINVTWRFSTAWMTGILVSGMVWVLGPAPQNLEWNTWTLIIYTILNGLALDFGYYLYHLCAHKIPWMWVFHRVHHSAETLQVFANVRVHPVEVAMTGPFMSFGASLILAPALYFGTGGADFVTILGINIMAAFYGLVGAQLHHTNLWISWGPVLEHVFISPAQHQIHHSTAERHWNTNMGGNFAIWDWMFGTLYIPRERETLTFGLGGGKPQLHPTLFAAYFEPFWALLPARLQEDLARAAGRLVHHRSQFMEKQP